MSSLRGFNSDKKLTDIINRINAIKAILEAPVLPSGGATEAKQDDIIAELVDIKDDTVPINAQTFSIDSKITQGDDSTITGGSGGLQQVLLYGRDNTTDLHPIKITPQGDIDVEIADFVKGQDVMADSFPIVIASDQSAITVSETFLRDTQNLSFTVSAGSNNTSAGINMSPAGNPTYRQVAIFGETDNITDFDMYVQFSNDNSNWYTAGYNEIIQLNVDPLDPLKSTFYKLIDSPPQWIRLLKLNSTPSLETLSVSSSRIN